MKIIKGVAIFVFLNALLGCFDPPEYSNFPEIDFLRIEFVEVGGFGEPDSLNLYINFKDGDGDLGLSSQTDDPFAINPQIDSPYHATNFYVGTGGSKSPVASLVFSNFANYNLVYKSNGKSPRDPTNVIRSTPFNQKFLTSDDRLEYNLPPFEAPYSTCVAFHQAYLTDTIFVLPEDKEALNVETIVDTLVDADNNAIGAYAALASWYIEQNPNHYNITVKFMKQEANGTFTEFDFREAYCTTYDGRFPVLADDKRAVEGTLKYAMIGTGFLSTFSITPIKLVVQVKDRAFNETPPLETPVFTLNDIRK
jgi:hypothetical protein